MFPSRMAGAALLVYRIAAAVTLLVNLTSQAAIELPNWAVPVPILLAIFLCLGFLTPYCAVLNCLIEFSILVATRGQNAFYPGLALVDGGVLAVLGPGAYSVDARIFGRQILTVPPRG